MSAWEVWPGRARHRNRLRAVAFMGGNDVSARGQNEPVGMGAADRLMGDGPHLLGQVRRHRQSVRARWGDHPDAWRSDSGNCPVRGR